MILVKADGNSGTLPTNRGPSNFSTPPWGGRPNRPVYLPKYRTAPKVVDQGLGAGANPAGAGGGGGPAEFDDQCPVLGNQKSQESKVSDYDYPSNAPKKSNQRINVQLMNKTKLVSMNYQIVPSLYYNLETKTAKKALKRVWKNPEAKEEVLAGLDRMNKGELLPRNKKNFKGFKTVKEIKLTDTRMVVLTKS